LPAHRDGKLHRAFSILVSNSNGELLLQRRAGGKYHFASLWSNTCCGHPRPGEDTPAAAERRLWEEFGFTVALQKPDAFQYRAEDRNSGLIEHEYLHVLHGRFNGEPRPNPDEIGAYRWIAPSCISRVIFPELGFYEVCLLATMLAATDAALGKGVVSNQAVPARLREGLNAESGLNDGMCVPIMLVFLALATGESQGEEGMALAFTLVAEEIGIGAAVGIVFAYLAVKILRIALKRGWFTDIWARIPVIGLALACFATADRLHGSGYIAAFVGGLLFGHMTRRTHDLVKAGEGMAELLAMLTWVVFGAVAVGQSWLVMTWPVLLYSLLSLTVIRMLPNVLALAGSGQAWAKRIAKSQPAA
jgi:isopentenyl-diphosphate delta-isomerase type 1